MMGSSMPTPSNEDKSLGGRVEGTEEIQQKDSVVKDRTKDHLSKSEFIRLRRLELQQRQSQQESLSEKEETKNAKVGKDSMAEKDSKSGEIGMKPSTNVAQSVQNGRNKATATATSSNQTITSKSSTNETSTTQENSSKVEKGANAGNVEEEAGKIGQAPDTNAAQSVQNGSSKARATATSSHATIANKFSTNETSTAQESGSKVEKGANAGYVEKEVGKIGKAPGTNVAQSVQNGPSKATATATTTSSNKASTNTSSTKVTVTTQKNGSNISTNTNNKDDKTTNITARSDVEISKQGNGRDCKKRRIQSVETIDLTESPPKKRHNDSSSGTKPNPPRPPPESLAPQTGDANAETTHQTLTVSEVSNTIMNGVREQMLEELIGACDNDTQKMRILYALANKIGVNCATMRANPVLLETMTPSSHNPNHIHTSNGPLPTTQVEKASTMPLPDCTEQQPNTKSKQTTVMANEASVETSISKPVGVVSEPNKYVSIKKRKSKVPGSEQAVAVSAAGDNDDEQSDKQGPKWSDLDCMDDIVTSPYEGDENAEVGEAIFEDFKALLKPSSDNQSRRPSRHVKPSQEAVRTLGETLAQTMVLANHHISISGIVYGTDWLKGMIRDVNCGFIPKPMLLVCLQEHRFARAETRVLAHLIHDLHLTSIIWTAIDDWGVHKKFPKLAEACRVSDDSDEEKPSPSTPVKRGAKGTAGTSGVEQPSAPPLVYDTRSQVHCQRCEIFVARAYTCMNVLKERDIKGRLAHKILACLEKMESNLEIENDTTSEEEDDEEESSEVSSNNESISSSKSSHDDDDDDGDDDDDNNNDDNQSLATDDSRRQSPIQSNIGRRPRRRRSTRNQLTTIPNEIQLETGENEDEAIDDNDDKEKEGAIPKDSRKTTRRRRGSQTGDRLIDRPVEKLCLKTGKVVHKYKTLSDALGPKHVRNQRTGIYHCLAGRLGSSGGYFYRYAGSKELPKRLLLERQKNGTNDKDENSATNNGGTDTNENINVNDEDKDNNSKTNKDEEECQSKEEIPVPRSRRQQGSGQKHDRQARGKRRTSIRKDEHHDDKRISHREESMADGIESGIVEQICSKTGKIVSSYKCIEDAYRSNGVPTDSTYIQQVLRGEKKHWLGHLWRIRRSSPGLPTEIQFVRDTTTTATTTTAAANVLEVIDMTGDTESSPLPPTADVVSPTAATSNDNTIRTATHQPFINDTPPPWHEKTATIDPFDGLPYSGTNKFESKVSAFRNFNSFIVPVDPKKVSGSILPTAFAKKFFGDQAMTLVSTYYHIQRSGMTYSADWIRGEVNGANCGKLDDSTLVVLCLQEDRLAEANHLVLATIVNELKLSRLISKAINSWDLSSIYPELVSINKRGHSSSSSSSVSSLVPSKRLQYYQCQIFLSRTYLCLQLIQQRRRNDDDDGDDYDEKKMMMMMIESEQLGSKLKTCLQLLVSLVRYQQEQQQQKKKRKHSHDNNNNNNKSSSVPSATATAMTTTTSTAIGDANPNKPTNITTAAAAAASSSTNNPGGQSHDTAGNNAEKKQNPSKSQIGSTTDSIQSVEKSGTRPNASTANTGNKSQEGVPAALAQIGTNSNDTGTQQQQKPTGEVNVPTTTVASIASAYGKPSLMKLTAMSTVVDSPYEELYSAEVGEPMFDRFKALLEPVSTGRRQIDPSAEAISIFGPALAKSLVSASHRIALSGMVYGSEWRDGIIRGAQCGYIPLPMLLLCLQEQRFARGSGNEGVLVRVVNDLRVCEIVEEAIEYWELGNKFPLLKSISNHGLFVTRKVPCLRCLIFVARAYRCMIALDVEPIDGSLLSKVHSCLKILQDNCCPKRDISRQSDDTSDRNNDSQSSSTKVPKNSGISHALFGLATFGASKKSMTTLNNANSSSKKSSTLSSSNYKTSIGHTYNNNNNKRAGGGSNHNGIQTGSAQSSSSHVTGNAMTYSTNRRPPKKRNHSTMTNTFPAMEERKEGGGEENGNWYPPDPRESILTPTEVEMAWLAEESLYSFRDTQISWNFIWQYASPVLKVELRKHCFDDDTDQFLKQLVRLKSNLVSERFNNVRKEIRRKLQRGFIRTRMKKIVSKLRHDSRTKLGGSGGGGGTTTNNNKK